jgi:hypothetical protein
VCKIYAIIILPTLIIKRMTTDFKIIKLENDECLENELYTKSATTARRKTNERRENEESIIVVVMKYTRFGTQY